jgi:hypothetical protein
MVSIGHLRTRVRCSLLRPDPAQRGRLEEIRANLHDRIAEAERESWLGEIEGLKVSLPTPRTNSPRSTRRTGGKQTRSRSACPHSLTSPAAPQPARRERKLMTACSPRWLDAARHGENKNLSGAR